MFEIVRVAFRVIYMLILARVILSWIPIGNPYNPIIKFIYESTETILAPIRRIMPRGSLPIDFSPLIAILLLTMIEGFVLSLFR
jgi:YggT family protein